MPPRKEIPKHYNIKKGDRFGGLEVISLAPPFEKYDEKGRRVDFREQYWCKCHYCNREDLIIVLGKTLITGRKKSCGCSRNWTKRVKTNHGLTQTRLHRIWLGMRDRCNRFSNISFPDYGGRGIYVCEEWNGSDCFENFYNWAITHGYKDDLTIERKDINGPYSPKNCKWISNQEQSFNKRNTLYIELNGEKIGLAKYCRENNLDLNRIRRRLHRNKDWTIEEILSVPKGKRPERLKNKND